ncbi:Alpha-catulin [Branchiostoma belcheri]|nr:Alpha-catulin [Branchiostoma belcheri]
MKNQPITTLRPEVLTSFTEEVLANAVRTISRVYTRRRGILTPRWAIVHGRTPAFENRALTTCNTHLVQPQSRQCGLRKAADGPRSLCLLLSRHSPGLFQNSDFLRFPTATTKYEAKSRQWTPLAVDAVSIRLIKTQQKRITTLVNHQEKRIRRTEKACRAVQRVGEAVSLAVDRFVTVGQAIGDQNQEIRQEMYDACQEARAAGDSIATITNVQYQPGDEELLFKDKSQMVRAARALLSSVTKVLMVADKVTVKQLLCAKDKGCARCKSVVCTPSLAVSGCVHRSLRKWKVSCTCLQLNLEEVSHFSEFVQLFSQFGTEMVELAHLSGDRQADLKDERARAKMGAARAVLERSTMMLLTSSKAENRKDGGHPVEILAARSSAPGDNVNKQTLHQTTAAARGWKTKENWGNQAIRPYHVQMAADVPPRRARSTQKPPVERD